MFHVTILPACLPASVSESLFSVSRSRAAIVERVERACLHKRVGVDFHPQS